MKVLFTIVSILIFQSNIYAQEKLSQIGIVKIDIDSSIVNPKYIGIDSLGNMYFTGFKSKSYREIVVKRLKSNGEIDSSYGKGGYAFIWTYVEPVDAKGILFKDSKVIVYTFHWLGYTDSDVKHGHYLTSTCLDKNGQLYKSYGENGIICNTPGIPLTASSNEYLLYSKSDTIIRTDFKGSKIDSFDTNENSLFKTDSYYPNINRKQRSDQTLVESSIFVDKEVYIGASIQSQITGKYDSIVIIKYDEFGRLDSNFGLRGRKSIKVEGQNVMLLSLASIDSLIYVSTSVWGLTQPIIFILNSTGNLVHELNLRKLVGFNDDIFVRGGLRGVKQLYDGRIAILTTFCGSEYNQYYLTIINDHQLDEVENYLLLSIMGQPVIGFEQLEDGSFLLFTIVDGFLLKHNLSFDKRKEKIKFYDGQLDLMLNHSVEVGEIFTLNNLQLSDYKIKDLSGRIVKEIKHQDPKRIKDAIIFISQNKGQFIIEATKNDKTKIREMIILQ